MANNTTLNTMSGGDVIATLDISGTKYARGVTGFLAPGGTSVTDVAAASPLPVTVGNFPATQVVSAASLPLPAGAATEATLSTLSGKVPALGQALAAGSLPIVLTAIQVAALTPPAAITGFATEATLSTASGTLLTISGKFGTLGQKAMSGSTPVVLASDQSALSLAALPTGTNTIGVTISPQQTGAVYSGTTALTPKFAVIAASSSGNTSAVALVSAKKIRVLKLTLSASAAVNVKFQSNTTDICGLIYCAASSGMGMGYCPVGHFETVAGETLNINLSAAIPVGGVLTYVEV